MYQKKDIKKVFMRGVWLSLAIGFAVFYYQDFIRVYIKPAVMEFVEIYGVALLYFLFGVFVTCGIFMIFIVWWLEWGDKKRERYVSKYISQLICDNYYGDYRKTNVYKAIKTCLSKFSRDSLEGEKDENKDQMYRLHRHHNGDVSRSDYNLAQQRQKVHEPQEDTSDGTHRTYHKNGRLEREVSYKNNVLHGEYRIYYEDGKLHQEKFFKNGKLDGIFKAYDEEGVLYFDISYKDGKQDGIMNTYYKTGILEYRETYKDGRMTHKETYGPSGELLFRQKYDQDESEKKTLEKVDPEKKKTRITKKFLREY